MIISIIVPCYNEQEALPIFYEEIISVCESLEYEYELLFIDDGSSDNTLELLREFANNNRHVVYFSFSKNFGKEAAMYAGLCNARGDYVAVIDADLQDPPSLLPDMIKILETSDYDSVATRRTDRKGEPVIRSWFARQFYKTINKISDLDIVDGARDYRLMKRDMVDAIVSITEYNRFSKGIFGWVGFKTYWMSYNNIERTAGKTKWNFWKLFKYAMNGIINFSNQPLQLASYGGIVFTLISMLLLSFIIVRRLIFGDPVAGWASTICIIVFIGGFQLFCMGVMGQYIAKTYIETKQRPHYIISESNRGDVKKVF